MRVWYQVALAEGPVRVYADLSARETDDLAKLFVERWPKLRVEWVRGNDADLVERAAREQRAGAVAFDVFVGDAGTALKGLGLAERWTPPEGRLIRPDYYDREGAWYGAAVTYHVLQYNTELVPATARPTQYGQLAHPGWYGRLALGDNNITWLKGLIESRGRQQTLDLLKPLAAQAIRFRPSPRILADFVSSGEHAVAIANKLDAVERDKRGGAKTAWLGIEPVVVQPLAVVLARDAPHPNIARLFANFLLTADAQGLLADRGRVPSRLDVDPEPQDLVAQLRIHVVTPATGSAERELRSLWDDLWRE